VLQPALIMGFSTFPFARFRTACAVRTGELPRTALLPFEAFLPADSDENLARMGEPTHQDVGRPKPTALCHHPSRGAVRRQLLSQPPAPDRWLSPSALRSAFRRRLAAPHPRVLSWARVTTSTVAGRCVHREPCLLTLSLPRSRPLSLPCPRPGLEAAPKRFNQLPPSRPLAWSKRRMGPQGLPPSSEPYHRSLVSELRGRCSPGLADVFLRHPLPCRHEDGPARGCASEDHR
jgi:hypothetical protein